LPDGELGVTNPNGVTIDANAAGYGWNVDGGQMNLQTVVAHEQGHVLGLPDADPALNPSDLMTETLAPGVHRHPTEQDVGAVSANGPAMHS
jgi:hypothetical protein